MSFTNNIQEKRLCQMQIHYKNTQQTSLQNRQFFSKKVVSNRFDMKFWLRKLGHLTTA